MAMNRKLIPPPVDTIKSWLIVFSSSLLFFYSFMQLNLLNPINEAIMRDFQMTPTEMGWLSSMYFFANFFLLFPAGIVLDRFSTKKLILIAMSFSIVSMFGFALSHSVLLAGFFRFLAGIGGAFCFIGPVRLASRWFSPKKLALVIGCLVTVGMLGGLVAQTPVNIVSEAVGWRNMMLLCGVVGIVFFIWMWVFVRDWQKTWEKKDIDKLEFWHGLYLVLKNRYNWFGGLYTAFLNLPIFVLGALWGQLYLTDGHGISRDASSFILSALFFGSIIGAPTMGWFSDMIKRRKLPMLFGAALSFVVVVLIMYLPNQGVVSLLVLFLLLGFFTSTQALSYPNIAELNFPLITGSASSIISSILIASGFVFQPLFGWLMKHTEKGHLAYTLEDFQKAMAVLPICFLLGFVFSLLLKETRCRRHI